MFVVLVKGAENVNAFSFVVNIVLLVAVKFDILVVCPFINNIDALENVFKLFVNPDTDKYDELESVFKLVNIVVDVALTLFIDNVELVDKLFKLVNIDVDVVFILLIDVV